VVGVWGAARVGVRLSPTNPYNDIADSNPAATFATAVGELNRFGLAYLHIVEPAWAIRLRPARRRTFVISGNSGAAR